MIKLFHNSEAGAVVLALGGPEQRMEVPENLVPDRGLINQGKGRRLIGQTRSIQGREAGPDHGVVNHTVAVNMLELDIEEVAAVAAAHPTVVGATLAAGLVRTRARATLARETGTFTDRTPAAPCLQGGATSGIETTRALQDVWESLAYRSTLPSSRYITSFQNTAPSNEFKLSSMLRYWKSIGLIYFFCCTVIFIYYLHVFLGGGGSFPAFSHIFNLYVVI